MPRLIADKLAVVSKDDNGLTYRVKFSGRRKEPDARPRKKSGTSRA